MLDRSSAFRMDVSILEIDGVNVIYNYENSG